MNSTASAGPNSTAVISSFRPRMVMVACPAARRLRDPVDFTEGTDQPSPAGSSADECHGRGPRTDHSYGREQ